MSVRFTPSPEQAAVIEAPLDSMRVAAGAGTGKTTTLAYRVAALVERGVPPEEILGITFTNKAAEELAERIRAVVGELVDASRQLEVHTYHGFAAALLREFGALVGVERGTDVITPAYTRQILLEMVHTVPTEVFDPTTTGAVDSLRRLASSLSDNLLSPRDVAAPPDGDEAWAKRAEMLAILCRYEEEKLRLGVADYGDLIRKAHQLVVEHPHVRDAIAARYRAVLLDEYQDTDPAQRELLRVLFAGRVAVTAVGDEDQTIYEWRGASLENFRRFPEHFGRAGAPAPTLPLTLNRRSGPAILQVANRIRREIDPADRSPLMPLPDAPAGEVGVGWFETAVAEAEWIASRLRALHEAGREWRQMAILFRKNRHMHVVHDALARHDIPFEVANLGGLLSVPEVADLHAWLRVIGRPEDGPALARILLGSRYRLGMGDLAHLSRWVRRRRGEQEADLDHDGALPDFTLVEAVDALDGMEGLRPEAHQALEQFRAEYRDLLVAAQGLSLVELCRAVLDRTGAWGDLDAMDEVAGLSARLNLYRFLDLASDWSPLEGRPSLDAFLDHLDALSQEVAEELDTARISGADAVTLITVHRAKGLEWATVFIPTVYRGNFPSTGSMDNPLTSPEVLPFELRLDAEHLPRLSAEMTKKEVDDLLRPRRDGQEWRIAYVAVTRARNELYLTGAHWYGHPQPTKRPAVPSPLMELVDGLEVSRRVRWVEPAPPRPEALGVRSEPATTPDPLFEGSWAAALRATLADPEWPALRAKELGVEAAYDSEVAGFQQMLFRIPEAPPGEEEPALETSATGLVTYALCPRRYYWSVVDRLPRRTTSAARRGLDVHRRIELHHRGVVPLDEVDTSSYDMVEEDSGGGGPDPFATFAASRFARERPLLVEAPFELRIGAGDGSELTVRGRIDAVYARDDGWEVVDFKTGLPRDDDRLLVQLETYAVAAEEVAFGVPRPERLSVTFAYLGGDEVAESTHRVDGDWMDRARTRLRSLAAGIAGEHWEASPSEACRRCDFLRFCPAGRAFLG